MKKIFLFILFLSILLLNINCLKFKNRFKSKNSTTLASKKVSNVTKHDSAILKKKHPKVISKSYY